MTQEVVVQPAATPQAPAAPAAPAAPPARTVSYTTAGPGGTVRKYTVADITALRARKKQLSEILTSANDRRREVQRSLRGATGADKAGLEQRLGVLDARIARLESEIDENSSQLSSLEAARVSSSMGLHWGPDTGNALENNAAPLLMLFILAVLCPIALSVSRFFWKRGSRPAIAPASAETTQRLERMEQAMDAIAIEVERVSEGQRFVTRILSEGRPDALGAAGAAMQPIPVGEERSRERF